MLWEGGKCCGRVENVVGGWQEDPMHVDPGCFHAILYN